MPQFAYDTPHDLANKVREKIPAYKNISDDILAKKALEITPDLWKYINPASFAQHGMWQPSSTGTHTVSTGRVKQSRAGRAFERAATGTVEAAPALGATVGGITGGAIGGLAGGVGAAVGAPSGAGIGGAAGEWFREKTEGEKPSARKIATEGAENAALEFVGGTVAPKVMEKVAAKALPKVWKSIYGLIGLNPADLSIGTKSAKNARNIAETVRTEAGIQKTAEAEASAIEKARVRHDDATVHLMNAPGGKVTDMHSVAIDRGIKLLDELESEGATKEQMAAVDKNIEGITRNLREKMTPVQLLEAKRDISRQITTWDKNTTNVRQRYLQGIYEDINKSIEKALPQDAAKVFRYHNQIQTNLITAREAARSTALKKELEKVPGLATVLLRVGGGAAIGAIVGETSGEGGGVKSAIKGAEIGAGLTAFGSVPRVARIAVPTIDAKTRNFLVKAMPKLAKVARYSPYYARAFEVVKAYLGGVPTPSGPKTQQLRNLVELGRGWYNAKTDTTTEAPTSTTNQVNHDDSGGIYTDSSEQQNPE